MVEELDKEFEDKMAALEKEKEEKKSDISEKVKVKKERQLEVDHKAVEKLEKEHKSVRERLMEEMWGQADEGEQDNKQPNHHDQPNSAPPPPPPAPDCPICFESMTPPTRIFQCGNGHLVCGGCKPKLKVFHTLNHLVFLLAVPRIKQIEIASLLFKLIFAKSQLLFLGLPHQVWTSRWRTSCGDGEVCCSNQRPLART